MSKCGEIRTTYTKGGLARFEMEITHHELNKFKLIKGNSTSVVKQKANAEMARWDEMWARQFEKQEKKNIAKEKTKQARAELAMLENILEHTLHEDNVIDWGKLKVKTDYPVQKPHPPTPLPEPPKLQFPSEPEMTHHDYQPKFGILDYFSSYRKQTKIDAASGKFKNDHATWLKNKQEKIEQLTKMLNNQKNKFNESQNKYLCDFRNWENEKSIFLQKQEQVNSVIDQLKDKYLSGDLSSVIEYCDIVLTSSSYPDYFPKTYQIDYNLENEIMIVDYQLPSPDVIPTVAEVKYIHAHDECQEKNLSQVQLNKLYDSILYQIALRTIHELYEADLINALQSVVFNGYVTSTDPATGREANACVFSVQANKKEFEQINLANITPKACFKKLKGVGCSTLHSLNPVAPIIQMDRDDKRFVSSYNVTSELNDNYNLAAMDWEDFEHLVREIFEKKFSSIGGEVKVTQASRDGGVDAIAFDPDPITGGKTVIQAKRYTNTVGVSAVRDLFGTVQHEGAKMGILVTTSDYGPDAHSFVADKPLTLINGNQLLYLLEEYGHSYKIDLKEAKQILADKENEEI